MVKLAGCTLVALGLLCLLGASPAAAQDVERGEGEIDPPPAVQTTSGDVSLLSGRTNGTGEVVIAGAAGWPWIWAHVDFGLDPAFNLGIRAVLVYGSPVMGVEPGVGGEASVPIRIHFFGEDELDLSFFLTPSVSFGEAIIVGERAAAAGDFGWGLRVEGGVLVGYRALEDITLVFGPGGQFGLMNTPSAGNFNAVGAVYARLGIEGLISRDTMLFALADAGVGFSPDATPAPLFGNNVSPLLRLSLGVGYLL